MSEMYGSSQSEQELQKVITCREIVKKIVDFGVSQEQILLIVQFLAYELENHDAMVELVALAKELIGSKTLLITKQEDGHGQTNS